MRTKMRRYGLWYLRRVLNEAVEPDSPFGVLIVLMYSSVGLATLKSRTWGAVSRFRGRRSQRSSLGLPHAGTGCLFWAGQELRANRP